MLSFWTVLVVTCLIGIIKYVINIFTYWKNKNVPYIPLRFPDTKTWLGQVYKNYYDWGKKHGYKHTGLFSLHIPTYMPIDLSIIRSILNTDFNYFSDRGMYYNEKNDPIGAHLFSLEEKKWKKLRSKLTPAFSSGKMKAMFPILGQVSCNLKAAIDELTSLGEPIDMKYYLQCYTIDIIGQWGFGLDCVSFKNPNSEFRRNGHKFLSEAKSTLFKGFLCSCYPSVANFLRMRITNKEVAEFYTNVIDETIKYRATNDVMTQNDFLQSMIDLKNDGDESLTTEVIAAQSFIFFVAGYETSSSTMTFCLYELALNLALQEKLRAEVNVVVKKYGGEVTYEGIQEMKYMEQVFNETLRKYPTLPSLNRKCVADYQVPNTDLVIKKHTLVIISVLGLQRDPDYYPDPEKFDPERFSDANRSKIKSFTYLPFGDGPRNCIGLRLGTIQAKVAIAVLLQNFVFSVNDKTADPSNMDPNFYTASNLNTIWFNVSKVAKRADDT